MSGPDTLCMQIMIIVNLLFKFFNKHLQKIARDFIFELRL